ncbi:porin family protein [Cesiribacter andamanensis]|nr:porin family protein [Cesiribacter andamanensis]
MKKRVITALLVFFASASAFAQSQIGLRVGANFATIQDGLDRLENMEEPWVPRLTLGVATSLAVNESFAIAPEFNYSQRGYEASGTNTLGQDFTYTYDYNFFEVPLLARLSFGHILKGYVNLGPTFSYLLGGKEVQEGGLGAGERSFDMDDERYKRFELGGALGGGIQLDTGIGSFLIDLRYNTGFTDFQTSSSSSLYSAGLFGQQPEKYRTQYVSTSLIFLVPGKR